MSERSAPVDRGAEQRERGAREQPDDELGLQTEFASALSALGNQRVQRLLSATPSEGVEVQRQEEGDSNNEGGDDAAARLELKNEVLNAAISAQALMNGAMQNVQSGSAENLPAAMEMVTSASEGLIEAYSAAAELDPTLHARMLGFRQSIVADIASLQPHVGDPVSLERIGHHMGNVTQLFGEQVIAEAQGTS